jgi:hypothetical protein
MSDVVGAACDVCTATAYAGGHEPFIVDDLRTRTRVWRCSRCGTLWEEGNVVAQPLSAAEADERFPWWREAADWLARTSLRQLLRLAEQGALVDHPFAVAVLHHDVLACEADPADSRPLVLYSGPDAASADGVEPGSLGWGSIARRMRWTSGRRRVFIDPVSPWGGELGDYVVEYLDANGRRTDTESDRRRES